MSFSHPFGRRFSQSGSDQGGPRLDADTPCGVAAIADADPPCGVAAIADADPPCGVAAIADADPPCGVAAIAAAAVADMFMRAILPQDGTPLLLRTKSRYMPGGATFALVGALTVSWLPERV